MADEAEPTKKSGNKVAIIAVSIVMLLTGGFFGLKMHGGGAGASAPEEELGDILPIHEFLVNLRNDPNKYLRTEISVQADGNFHKDDLDKNMDAIMDAIVGVLRTETMENVSSASDTRKLKQQVAAAANAAYWAANPKKTPPDIAKATVHKDWDSNSGPILKVYFTSFAFQ